MVKRIIVYVIALVLFLILPNYLSDLTGAKREKDKAIGELSKAEQTVSYESDKFFIEETNLENVFGVFQKDLWIPLPRSLRTKEFLTGLELKKIAGEDWAPIYTIEDKLKKEQREYRFIFMNSKGKEISHKKAKQKPIVSNLQTIIFTFGLPNTELPSSPWTDSMTLIGFKLMAFLQVLLIIREIRVYKQDKEDGVLHLGRERPKKNSDVQLDKSDELYLEEEDYEKYYSR